MTLAEQLATILTDARGDRPRRHLASDVGVSNTALVQIEQGKANPTLERVERLAEAYGVELRLVSVADLQRLLAPVLPGDGDHPDDV